VISALSWRGTPYRLLETIRRQDGFQLYSSSALLEELADVTSRPALAKRLSVIGKTAPQIFADYLEAVELVEPVGVPRVARDPDDDDVLARALAASAELIVSGDPDLLVLTAYERIPIVTLAAALRQIQTPT
jgi:putative PIN family toxin of toxin-antitoxin system